MAVVAKWVEHVVHTQLGVAANHYGQQAALGEHKRTAVEHTLLEVQRQNQPAHTCFPIFC